MRKGKQANKNRHFAVMASASVAQVAAANMRRAVLRSRRHTTGLLLLLSLCGITALLLARSHSPSHQSALIASDDIEPLAIAQAMHAEHRGDAEQESGDADAADWLQAGSRRERALSAAHSHQSHLSHPSHQLHQSHQPHQAELLQPPQAPVEQASHHGGGMAGESAEPAHAAHGGRAEAGARESELMDYNGNHNQNLQPHHDEQRQQGGEAGSEQHGQQQEQEKEEEGEEEVGAQFAQMSVEQLRQRAAQLNAAQQVVNLHLNPTLLNDSQLLVLVAMCHDRASYFQLQMQSLRTNPGLEHVLLIISQDLFTEEYEAAIAAVDFVPYIRIFFPYSLQLYPHEFPGTDPRDCPRDATPEQAKQLKCLNADHPDRFKHYREAKYTAVKHHWWWKLNYVFDGMPILRNHKGYKLLLEEDYYFGPDALHVLGKLAALAENPEYKKDILVLGDHAPKVQSYIGAAYREVWAGNMGMAISRATFEAAKRCHKAFCEFDDYNWDFSFGYLSMSKCTGDYLHALRVAGARMFHVGTCGLHKKATDCSSTQILGKIHAVLQGAEAGKKLFPEALRIIKIPARAKPTKSNGGWGDLRDRQLCESFVIPRNDQAAVIHDHNGHN